MSRQTRRSACAFRFLLDEHIPTTTAVVARNLGLDAVSVFEHCLEGVDDEALLQRATSEGRILVTRNRNDFEILTSCFFAAERPHAGVLIVPYSIPGTRPEPLAYALLGWSKRMGVVLGGRPLEQYSLHFLSASDALHGREE